MIDVFEKFRRKNKNVCIKSVEIKEDAIIATVSGVGNIATGQEVLAVTPIDVKLSTGKERKIKKVIARAKVKTIDGNSLVLTAVPRGESIPNTKIAIDNCLKKSQPIYLKEIEKW